MRRTHRRCGEATHCLSKHDFVEYVAVGFGSVLLATFFMAASETGGAQDAGDQSGRTSGNVVLIL